MTAIGIDLGGHGVKAGIVKDAQVHNLQTFRYPSVVENPSIAKADVPQVEIVQAVFDAIETLSAVDPALDLVGLSSTGIIDPVSGRVVDGQGSYIGTEWRKEFTNRLGDRFALAVENDAKAAAWGEYSSLPQRPSGLAHLIVGSGIGAGFVLNNSIVNGANFVAGEFGCLRFTRDGEKIESHSASPGLLRASGCATVPELNDAYVSGDERSVFALQIGAQSLGNGIAAIINILGPEVITIGGGLVEIIPGYLDLIIEQTKLAAEEQAFKGVAFAPSQLGNDAGIIGIAQFALEVRADESKWRYLGH